MPATLTYHLRSGTLSVKTSGKHFSVATYRRPEKTLPDTVGAGAVAHMLGIGSGDKLDVYDYPGDYAHRFDGSSDNLTGGRDPAMGLESCHPFSGRGLLVRSSRTYFCIHGWPPCNLHRCIVVPHSFEDLRVAVAADTPISFFVLP
jgi:hypothetical protein